MEEQDVRLAIAGEVNLREKNEMNLPHLAESVTDIEKGEKVYLDVAEDGGLEVMTEKQLREDQIPICSRVYRKNGMLVLPYILFEVGWVEDNGKLKCVADGDLLKMYPIEE